MSQPGQRTSKPLYQISRLVLVSFFSRMYWRVTVDGMDNVPSSGAFVIAPVHRSNIDFLLIANITRRRIRFMAKDSLWRVPMLGPLISMLGAFPVHREVADREAFRLSLDVLNHGEPLVVFPEGTRKSGPVVAELFEGSAYLAMRAGVPLLPVGIGGSEAAMPRGSKWIRPVKVHVVVGAPLYAGCERPRGTRVSRSSVHKLTMTLHDQIQQLFDEARGRAGQ